MSNNNLSMTNDMIKFITNEIVKEKVHASDTKRNKMLLYKLQNNLFYFRVIKDNVQIWEGYSEHTAIDKYIMA